ncbi:tRNA isopentenyltransferase, partial [Aspergillus campestris IBT 28561]
MNYLSRLFFPRKRLSAAMKPLIAVVGATGTGKSKLAVDLASRFNGEIINGDAMQMYRGLSIITNQIPVEERNGIPHHLLSCVELDEEPWRVGLFKKECLRIIQEIHDRGKLPILVGGTHYYTQAVLFNDQLVGDASAALEELDGQANGEPIEPSTRWPILNAPTEVILQKLREVDPVMAQRWHPNDGRKIRRSLEIYFQTGRPASEVYAEQKRAKEGALTCNSSDGTGQLRFPTMFFWIHSEKEVLNSRLDGRVGVMLEQGLLSEAQLMWDYLREKKSQGITVDQTRGVWVAIGFKELAPYLEELHKGTASPEELEALKRTCIESIKTATRQYSTSQIKWIRNKLWRALAAINETSRLYLLDSTNVENWTGSVTDPSEHLVRSLLSGEPTPDPKSLSDFARTVLGEKEAKSREETDPGSETITCDVCKRTLANSEQWNIHIRGQAHKRVLKAAVRRAQREERIAK